MFRSGIIDLLYNYTIHYDHEDEEQAQWMGQLKLSPTGKCANRQPDRGNAKKQTMTSWQE